MSSWIISRSRAATIARTTRRVCVLNDGSIGVLVVDFMALSESFGLKVGFLTLSNIFVSRFDLEHLPVLDRRTVGG